MEAVDVSDGEYEAYDAEGFVLSLSVRDDRVVVGRTADQYPERAADRLRAVLVASPVVVEGRTLSEMIRSLLDQERGGGATRLWRRMLRSRDR